MSFVSSAGITGPQHNKEAFDVGGIFAFGAINFGGYHKNGRPFDADLSLPVHQSTTLGDIIGHLDTNVLNGSTASLSNGRIQITDDTGGYSKTDTTMSYSGDISEITMPDRIATLGIRK